MGPCCLSEDKLQLQHIGVVIPSHIYEFGVHPDLCPFGHQKIWEVNQYYYQLFHRIIKYLSLFQLAPQPSRSPGMLQDSCEEGHHSVHIHCSYAVSRWYDGALFEHFDIEK